MWRRFNPNPNRPRLPALRAEAELALRETDPTQVAAALERVVQDADQLTSIVNRMLARSRSRDVPAEPVLVVIAEASDRWQRQAALSEVDVIIDVDDGISPETCCPELAEVVDPIIDNAIRYAESGGEVNVSVLAPDPETLSVTITNFGSPISPELAPHIFDAWVSDRDASTAGGLGLWLARETARDVGGEVEFVDTVGATTFRVHLPCSPAI